MTRYAVRIKGFGECRYGHAPGGDSEYCHMGHVINAWRRDKPMAYHPLYQAALDADNAYQRELERVHGPAKASEERYRTSNFKDAGVREAYRNKLKADEAWREALRQTSAYRTGTLAYKAEAEFEAYAEASKDSTVPCLDCGARVDIGASCPSCGLGDDK